LSATSWNVAGLDCTDGEIMNATRTVEITITAATAIAPIASIFRFLNIGNGHLRNRAE